MNNRKLSAAAFCVGSSGASTENVVEYTNPTPMAAIIWNGIVTATCVFSLSSVRSPTPMAIPHQPTKFCARISKSLG